MAGSRGYHSYHGRTPKWKIALAVLLVLVILAAVGVIALQEHVVYDETGTPHLRLPVEKTEEAPPQEDDSVELTIQAPQGPETLCALALPEGPLTLAGLEAALDTKAADVPSYNAAVVTLKGADGTVYFDSAAAVSGCVSLAPDTDDALKKLAERTAYTAARISCFRDPKAANHDVKGMGLENTGGYIFYDGNNNQWLDPAKPAARQYLCDLAKEAAALGFDEVVLTDVSYPTEGKLNKIAYGEGAKRENLLTFLAEMRTALEPYSVALSVELPETAFAADGAEGDLSLSAVAAKVDRIYAQTDVAQADALAARVEDAGTADFVAELREYDDSVKGNCLILPQ
ncbi:putative glycoside hydrolase [Oscillibacter sp.]|uniref:putative glycoside hydrolase n=1 Tax=Oscillibacter sp. TaxID=1945593 RepID=UPI00261E6992|nr:putative glycoside hydrolase [Oscillibacter sp.]MDD3346367.1 putative glycoside hydrolase [Oscillibacter sp.]